MIFGVLNLLVNTMNMIRSNKFVHFILAAFCFILVSILIGIKPDKDEYNFKIIKEVNGWSYVILRDNTPYIYQKYIPCMQGNNEFESRTFTVPPSSTVA